ncbi:host attachment protein [Belnapia sp. T6]|uniref:Host attachment protein n=1 Tax=Belnapia mucosa TaxID=2804532 RepID=A0ABS1V927_9PROT|nr:host attachment protein [Belnapia mucosa]MBL6458170.1 host attachment protein [Belnapia mucosa]
MRQEPGWVLVADGQRARVLERPSLGAPWEELEAEAWKVFDPPSRSLGTDRPGRVHESLGTTRHALEPRHDPHEARKVAFASDLAHRLEAAAEARRFARLILVAPPAFLGHLRDALGDGTRQRLKGSLDLDLTKATLAEIVAHLPEHRPA